MVCPVLCCISVCFLFNLFSVLVSSLLFCDCSLPPLFFLKNLLPCSGLTICSRSLKRVCFFFVGFRYFKKAG